MHKYLAVATVAALSLGAITVRPVVAAQATVAVNDAARFSPRQGFRRLRDDAGSRGRAHLAATAATSSSRPLTTSGVSFGA